MKTIDIVHGDDGYTIKVPSTEYKRCEECMCFDHWGLSGVESNAKYKNKFYFKCTNIYHDVMGEWECQGRLELEDD